MLFKYRIQTSNLFVFLEKEPPPYRVSCPR